MGFWEYYSQPHNCWWQSISFAFESSYDHHPMSWIVIAWNAFHSGAGVFHYQCVSKAFKVRIILSWRVMQIAALEWLIKATAKLSESAISQFWLHQLILECIIPNCIISLFSAFSITFGTRTKISVYAHLFLLAILVKCTQMKENKVIN